VSGISLSILIPSRNEEFLARTCEDILAHIEGDTEIIAVIDGQAAGPELPVDPRLRVIRLDKSIGQRAAQNLAARNSTARYVMKLDAHCAVEPGFDRKLMAVMEDDMTIVPVMRNLWVFDWVCDFCGARKYQGPKPTECAECKSDGGHIAMEMIWNPKVNPQNSAYRFNKDLQFKYFGELRQLQGTTGLQESMSLQGSCFMATRENYWARELCDESWGSWGQQGTEVALKTWLSGGRVLCLRDTWYAHLFRTQEGFSFPYPLNGKSQDRARKISRDIFLNDNWPKQVRPLAWLIEKFWEPLSRIQKNDRDLDDWNARWQLSDIETLKARPFVIPATGKPYTRPVTKSIIYYTDNQLDDCIARPVRDRLAVISRDQGMPITSASLKRMDFGAKNVWFHSHKRGHLTMFRQILGALENSHADVVFFCEHDVLYHPSHFDFIPPEPDRYYYNTNVWQVRPDDGHAVYFFCRKLSQMSCYRALAIAHYRTRIAMVEANGGVYDPRLGFEPGTRGTRHGGVDDSGFGDWRSAVPNIDIRHAGTLSKSKWSPADFRNPKNNIDWQEATSVPGWGVTEGRFDAFLAETTI
jgi:hypothetical protein